MISNTDSMLLVYPTEHIPVKAYKKHFSAIESAVRLPEEPATRLLVGRHVEDGRRWDQARYFLLVRGMRWRCRNLRFRRSRTGRLARWREARKMDQTTGPYRR